VRWVFYLGWTAGDVPGTTYCVSPQTYRVVSVIVSYKRLEGSSSPGNLCTVPYLRMLNVDRSGLLTICIYSHARWIRNLIAQTGYTLSLRKTSHDH